MPKINKEKIKNESKETIIKLIALSPCHFSEVFEDGSFNKFYVKAGDIVEDKKLVNQLLGSALMSKFKVIEC